MKKVALSRLEIGIGRARAAAPLGAEQESYIRAWALGHESTWLLPTSSTE